MSTAASKKNPEEHHVPGKLAIKILEMRREGRSYNEIAGLLNTSKGNVSYHCNRWFSEQEHATMVRDNTNPTVPEAAHAAAREYAIHRSAEATDHWRQRMDTVRSSDPELFGRASGLYLGEGNHHGTEFTFSNSDPALLRDWTNFLVLIRSEYSGYLQLHATHKVDECVQYWAENRVLEPDWKIYVQKPKLQKKLNGNTHRNNHGTVNIRSLQPLGMRLALLEILEPTLGLR